jgi:hypothetical protein
MASPSPLQMIDLAGLLQAALVALRERQGNMAPPSAIARRSMPTSVQTSLDGGGAAPAVFDVSDEPGSVGSADRAPAEKDQANDWPQTGMSKPVEDAARWGQVVVAIRRRRQIGRNQLRVRHIPKYRPSG